MSWVLSSTSGHNQERIRCRCKCRLGQIRSSSLLALFLNWFGLHKKVRTLDARIPVLSKILLWCTQSFSIVVSSPNCNFERESGYNGKLAKDICNAISNSEYMISNGVTLLGSLRRFGSVITGRLIRTPGGSYCEMEELN